MSSWVRGICKIVTKFLLAWYEAEGKKRPRPPSPDDHDKGEREKADEGTPQYHCDDVAVVAIGLTVKLVEQTSNLVRGCRKEVEGVVEARANTEK